MSTDPNVIKVTISENPVPYEDALSAMEERVASIHKGNSDEHLWFLEHPPIYTAGTSAKDGDLVDPSRFPVHKTGRGGQYAYHGPGQRVVYVMLDLKKRQPAPDVKKYVWQLEEWVIHTLAVFNILGKRHGGRIGIWVNTDKGEEKIAAIGVRIRHWTSYHGLAINVAPDLSHYEGIVPCDINEYGITSLSKLLGRQVEMKEIDEALLKTWDRVFEAPPHLSSAA
jgi:lipoyl(octanoyl) transferase